MNKSELVDSIAAKSGLSKVQANDALNAFIASVGEALAKNDSIALVGFGTFAEKSVPHVLVVIHKLVQKCKSQQAKFQALKRAKA